LVLLLTLEELYVLQFTHNHQGYTPFAEGLIDGSRVKKPFASTQEIADAFEITKEYATQLCIRLQGFGLLYPAGLTVANIEGFNLLENFGITEYVETFIKYILEPEMEKN
jgi:hypothetical protein